MGNTLRGQSLDPNATLDYPDLDTSWSDFQARRASPYAEMEEVDEGVNGFIFGGVVLPENVLEVILSSVEPKDILRCSMVCKAWKDVITLKSYWRRWFDENGWDWNMIPEHVRARPNSWIVFHAQVLHQIFTKNFITNHSGIGDREREFRNWTILNNGGDGWRLESPPIGSAPLPPDPFFQDSNSAWATSFQLCSKATDIELWRTGLTPPVMALCLPFSFVCSQMYAPRFDCGGEFRWTLRTLDRNQEAIHEFFQTYQAQPNASWERAEHCLPIKEIHEEHLGDLRSVAFIHEGKDDRFWKGFYGMKFSRSCVKFRCDPPTTCQDLDKTVT